MQLFNLETDLREEHDISSEYPEIVEKLYKLMDEAYSLPENVKFRF